MKLSFVQRLSKLSQFEQISTRNKTKKTPLFPVRSDHYSSQQSRAQQRPRYSLRQAENLSQSVRLPKTSQSSEAKLPTQGRGFTHFQKQHQDLQSIMRLLENGQAKNIVNMSHNLSITERKVRKSSDESSSSDNLIPRTGKQKSMQNQQQEKGGNEKGCLIKGISNVQSSKRGKQYLARDTKQNIQEERSKVNSPNEKDARGWKWSSKKSAPQSLPKKQIQLNLRTPSRQKDTELDSPFTPVRNAHCSNKSTLQWSLRATPTKTPQEFKGVDSPLKFNKLGCKRGLPNIGNTCYMNAVLQCLFHYPNFNDYFVKDYFIEDLNGETQKGVARKYKNLYFNLMKKAVDPNCKPEDIDLSTLPLKKIVSKISCLFQAWEQQDAHQFMRQLLDSLHQDLNRSKQKTRYKDLNLQHKSYSLDRMALQYWRHYKANDDSYIYDNLCGQTCTAITCASCSTETHIFDNFLDLSLPMIKGKKRMEDLLKEYFSSEELKDPYLCNHCKKSTKRSLKKVDLWKTPDFLIIQMKRSQFGKKNSEPITFPMDCLNLKGFMELSNDPSVRKAVYSLYGVVSHRGQADGGHYWADIKQNGRWYSIDDEKVVERPIQEVRSMFEEKGSTESYILFYSSLTR